MVNYLVCSKKFAFGLTKENQPKKALNKLSTFNTNVVITLGDKGVIWKTKEGDGKLPAIKIDAVDTTGAGDVFHGAFVYCLAKGMGLESALKFSNSKNEWMELIGYSIILFLIYRMGLNIL